MRILGTHHLAITTRQLERLRRFYVETLGNPVEGEFGRRDIVFVGVGNTRIELIGEPAGDGAESERADRRGWHHLAWEVENVDGAYAELTARGVESHSPPEDFPPEAPALRIAFLRDPDGNLLELVQTLRRGATG